MCHMTTGSKAIRGRFLPAAAAILTATVFFHAPVVAAEDGPNILTAPFALSLGTFTLSSDTKVRLDGETTPGTPFDWENTFGGGDVTRFRIDGHWRFGDSDRHKMRFMWFSTSREKSKTLDRDIEFQDQVFPASATVTATSSFDIYELAYEYALWHRDTWEVNASIGLHVADLSLGLKAKASTSNGTLSGDVSREAKVAAPLPVVGVRGLWQLPHNFYIDASAQYFSLSIDEFDGRISDYKLAVNWQPKTWLGIGVGYNQFDVDVDVNKDRFNGNLNWSYKGPMIYYSAVF
jgi:hypothetical protein